MARRNEHTREQLRALILEAARHLIEQDGVAALSTRRIAQRIGYTSGTLYQHFEDVADIVLHVNARTLQGLMDDMLSARPTLPAAPGARIHAYADVYLAYVRANRNAWDAMFTWRRTPDDPAPDWYSAHIEKLVAMIAECFAALPARTDGTTPVEAARLVWASVHSVCALDSGGRLDLLMRTPLPRLVHHLVDIHVDAYSGGSAPPS